MKNEYLKIKIDSFGAELKSLKNLQNNIEYLWQSDPKYWNRSSPILFPIVGKLLDDEYIYKDKTYNMSQHGFARDKEFILIKQKENYLKFLLKSDPSSLKIYPFSFELFISYTLHDNELKISYEVVNKSAEKMYFSIGAHPAFNWPIDDMNTNKDDYYFEFDYINKDILKVFPLLKEGISNKKFDIKLDKKKLNIDENIFKDDALILKNENINRIKLKNIKNNKFIEVNFEGFSYLGLWSKPTGAPFVCIEPWHGIADFVNHNKNIEEKEGINILEENEIFLSSYVIKI